MYVPTEGTASAVPGRMCEPNYKSPLFKREGVLVSIVVAPTAAALSGSVQVDVAAGHSLTFQDANLRVLTSTSAAPLLARLRGGRYPADKPIPGFALTEFGFAVELAAPPPEITIALPTLVVDGAVVEPPPIRFSLKHQAMVIGLCQ